MTFSDAGIAWLTEEEAFRSTSYLDQAGVWTIGFGTIRLNGEPVEEGMSINLPVGYALLRGDVSDAVADVRRLITVPLAQPQFDALVSFTYNVGGGALATSTLRKTINAGAPVTEDLFTRWNKVTDPHTGHLVVSNGLTDRRRREYARFAGRTQFA